MRTIYGSEVELIGAELDAYEGVVYLRVRRLSDNVELTAEIGQIISETPDEYKRLALFIDIAGN